MTSVLAKQHQVPYLDGAVDWFEYGQGEPLVLLHGGHGNAQHWIKNVQTLSTYYRVLVPDMPGFGASGIWGGNNINDLLTPLIATLNTLIGEDHSFDLMGFSFGALIAVNLADRTQRVNKMALLGAVGHGGTRRPKGEFINWKPAYKNDDQPELQRIMRENLSLHMLSSIDRVDDLALQIHTEACIATRFRSRDISRAGGMQELLSRYKGDLLLIWGEHDVTSFPEQVAKELSGICLQAQAHIIPNVGHWVQYEAAPEVNAIFDQWSSGH
jgi:pimeloyl-ACP methyl ester carboxylesterase